MDPNHPGVPRSLPSTGPQQQSGGEGSGGLLQEERDLIKILSAQCRDLRVKNPSFDSKKFLHSELQSKCGPGRTNEIMAYMQKMTKSRQTGPNDPSRLTQPPPLPQQQPLQPSQLPYHHPPSAGTLPQNYAPRAAPLQQVSQVPGPYLLPAFQSVSNRPGNPTTAGVPHHPNRSQGHSVQSQQQQHQQQQQQHMAINQPRGPTSGQGEKRPDGRVELGLDVPPTFEELAPLTNNLMQVNILTDREIKSEADASEANLRQSVKNDNLIPAIGARPGVNPDNFASRISNVVDESMIAQSFNQIMKPYSQQPHLSQTLSQDAALILSEGIQIHLTQIIDAAIIHSRKRTNRTATEHFVKSQLLIEKDLPGSGPGEVVSVNRGNLGMLWGPPRLEELEEHILSSNDQFTQRKILLMESIKQDLTADEEKRLQKKKGQNTLPTAGTMQDPWWIRDEKMRDGGTASLEEIAMMRLRQEVAKNHELGPHNTSRNKKVKKEEDMEQEEAVTSAADEFMPTYRPNPQIQFEKTPLKKSNWKPQRCPLAEKDKLAFLTVTRVDVISALSKGRGNDLPNTRGTSDFGTALRIAKSVSTRR